jgi:hypothetical protein
MCRLDIDGSAQRGANVMYQGREYVVQRDYYVLVWR